MSNHNVFAGAFVERDSHRREDTDWLKTSVRSADARFVPVWGDRCLARGDPLRAILLSREQIASIPSQDEIIFLGTYRGLPAFALRFDGDGNAPYADPDDYHDLRYLGSMLSAEDANLVAHARALVLWHGAHRYCGACGSASRAESGGNSRLCTSSTCATRMFPRVDPAIIVIVENGDKCLLGRQPGWPEGRYSTIAGFVEPGESLEDAVRREVLEETNIRVADVRYHSSQPWPFPSSLMLGFHAVASSTEIRLNDGELEDARWFTRKELRSGFPKLPYRVSIARRLVDGWLNDNDADR